MLIRSFNRHTKNVQASKSQLKTILFKNHNSNALSNYFLEFVAYYFFGSFDTVIINKNLSESFLLKMTSKSLLNYGNLIKQEQYYLDFRMRLG